MLHASISDLELHEAWCCSIETSQKPSPRDSNAAADFAKEFLLERLTTLRQVLMTSHDRAVDLVEECAKTCCTSPTGNVETCGFSRCESGPRKDGQKDNWCKQIQNDDRGEKRELSLETPPPLVQEDGDIVREISELSEDNRSAFHEDAPNEDEVGDRSVSPLQMPNSVYDSTQDDDIMSCLPQRKMKQDAQFKILDCWSMVRRRDSNLPVVGSLSSVRRSMRDSGRPSAYNGVEYDIKVYRQDEHFLHKSQTFRCICHPNHALRATWDCLSVTLLLYDLIMVPLLLFELPQSAAMDFGAWVCRVFWTIDIPLSFLTGYLTEDGSFEMRFSFIVKRYLRTWFTLDMIIVTLDWLELCFRLSNGFGVMRGMRASRFVRILRMLRLLRILRLQDAIKGFMEQVKSERLSLLAEITKMTICIIFVSHSIACSWYWVGSLHSGEDTWIIHAGFNGKPLSYKYVTAMHWAMSQFQGGMDEVRPWNVPERIFAVTIYLFTYLCAIVFVSRITSSTTQLFMINQRESVRVQQLRQYLTQNSVPRRLAVRITRNAQDASRRAQRRIASHHVELLQLVSEPLHEELNFELFGPVFDQHMFFFRYADECPQVMGKVCHMAVSNLEVSDGDVVFHCGETPLSPRMFVIGKGMLQYMDQNGKVARIHESEFVAEAVLWTSWVHCGTLTAESHCLIHVVNSDTFQKVVSKFLHDKIAADANPLKYAQKFVDALNDCTEQELSDCFRIESDFEVANPGAWAQEATGKSGTMLSGSRFIDWVLGAVAGDRRHASIAKKAFGTKDAFSVTPQAGNSQAHPYVGQS